MESKVSYTVVGLFVLLLGAAFGALVLWLSVGEYRTDSHCYYVYMQESVSGLSADAAVKAALVQRGIDAARLETIGYGASRPLTQNRTPAGRAMNRRVTLSIIDSPTDGNTSTTAGPPASTGLTK